MSNLSLGTTSPMLERRLWTFVLTVSEILPTTIHACKGLLVFNAGGGVTGSGLGYLLLEPLSVD